MFFYFLFFLITMATFFNIAYISKVSLANLNSGEGTGWNITPIKKINDFEWNSYSYISGQAIRRYMKDTLQQMGNIISSVDEQWNPALLPNDADELIKKRFSLMGGKKESWDKDLMTTQVYQKYLDLDLFGYMFPKGERRRSPVKVSPMIATGFLKGDTDYLTRKQLAEWWAKSGNIVQTEIETMNFYRWNVMIKTDDIGVVINEYTYQRTDLLSEVEKKARLKTIIDMIKNLNGWSKTARMLEDISPKFVVCAKQSTGNPLFLNLLHVDESKNLIIDSILATINDYRIDTSTVRIGLTQWIFANESIVKQQCEQAWISVTGVASALDFLVS